MKRILPWMLAVSLCGPSVPAHAEPVSAPRPSLEAPRPEPEQGQLAEKPRHLFFLAETGLVIIELHLKINGQSLDAAWETYLDGYFQQLDRNGNHVIEGDELQAVPTVQTLRIFGLSTSNQRSLTLREMTPLTRTQLSEYFRDMGFEPFELQMLQLTPAQLFNQGQVFMMVGNTDLFPNLDTNSDDKLSFEEIEQLPKLLQKSDLNQDESLALTELSGGNPYLVAQQRNLPRRMVSNPAEATFLFRGMGRSAEEIAQALQERLNPPREGVEPAQLPLTAEQLGFGSEEFQQYDTDGNGLLDKAELVQMVIDPQPHLVLEMQQGKIEEGEPRVRMLSSRESGSGQSLEENNRVLLQTASSRVEFHSAPAATAVNSRSNYQAVFNQADQDKNGYVDDKEAQLNGFLRQLFTLADRNQDGKVFSDEYNELLDTFVDAASFRCQLSVSDQGRVLFRSYDLDHDGRLSPREMLKALETCKAWDVNQDGVISRSEIPRQIHVTFQQQNSSFLRSSFNAVVITNQSGMTSQLTTEGPLWFRKMDRNRDGDLSPREFLGTSEDFQTLDQDGDNLIDPEEAAAAKPASQP